MYDISNDRPLPGRHSDRDGLTNTLRNMRKGDSIEIPFSKKPSVYSAAKLAGVKVTVRSTSAVTAIVWRLDGSERPSIFSEAQVKSEIFK